MGHTLPQHIVYIVHSSKCCAEWEDQVRGRSKIKRCLLYQEIPGIQVQYGGASVNSATVAMVLNGSILIRYVKIWAAAAHPHNFNLKIPITRY